MSDGLYLNTKTKGNQAEMEVLCYFHRHGYSVSLPFGDNAPYDLIVESPTKKCYRVQVRASTWKGDAIDLNLRVICTSYRKTIDKSRIDIFALWDGTDVYLIPTKDVENMGAAFRLRRSTARNNQTKGVHLAATYLSALHFCP